MDSEQKRGMCMNCSQDLRSWRATEGTSRRKQESITACCSCCEPAPGTQTHQQAGRLPVGTEEFCTGQLLKQCLEHLGQVYPHTWTEAPEQFLDLFQNTTSSEPTFQWRIRAHPSSLKPSVAGKLLNAWPQTKRQHLSYFFPFQKTDSFRNCDSQHCSKKEHLPWKDRGEG